MGYVNKNQKIDLYNLCDCYIMVSHSSDISGDSEGFGITFLEANACGKPVIGSNTGGIPDAVEHNVSGLLVEPDNVEQTAQAIIQILSNLKLRHSLGRNGRARVEKHFTWDIITDRIWKLFINHRFKYE